MDRRNKAMVGERDEGRQTGYGGLLGEVAYLRQENRQIHQENEKLREIFRIAVVEFERKNKEIEGLRAAIEKAEDEIKALIEENGRLKGQLEEERGKVKILNNLAFGTRSERQQEEKGERQREYKRRGAIAGHKGNGRNIPEGLPVVEEVIDIPDEEKFCPICGLPYKEAGMAEEVSSEVCVETIYYLKRIKRKKYKKTCTCPNQIITVPVPGKLIPKGKYCLSFWIEVLINKYKNHVPIQRQVNDMRDYGLVVSSGSIFGGLNQIYHLYLEPLYQGLIKGVRQSHHIHIDESGWKVFVLAAGKGNYNGFIWVFVCKDINVILYVIRPSRGAAVPCKTLFDMEIEEVRLLSAIPVENKKRITVDRFSSYKTLERLGLVELTYCWAHQRRDFISAKIKHPELKEWADAWIKKIAVLYQINNERIKYSQETDAFKRYDAQLKEAIADIESLMNTAYPDVQQASLMESMKAHWQGLTMFVDNPDVDMDNNISERMLRSPVLGRKNYWGNHSRWAAQLSATMFSIIQTCAYNNISPRAYLSWYLTEW